MLYEVITRSKDVDKLVSVSDFFAGVMKERMKLSDEQLKTIYLGVDVDVITSYSIHYTKLYEQRTSGNLYQLRSNCLLQR